MHRPYSPLLAACAVMAVALGVLASPAVQVKTVKGTALSRAIEAIDKAGGTYGYRQLGGKEFAATAKRLGYDERSYYDVLRLSFGAVNAKEPLGDAGLNTVAEHIAAFPGLEMLDLRGNDLTDNGLKSLPPLPKLQTLWLDGTDITDAAVAEMAVRFPALTSLKLEGTAVTVAGEAAIRKLLPKCKVSR